jgi:flagellar hook-length control protein FliK
VQATSAGFAPPVAQPELEAALTRLRTRASGTHELTVQLHPADLGAVRVVAVLSGDDLDVTVLCADHAAQQAVAAAIPALHDRLAELRNLDISTPGQASASFADGSQRQPHGDTASRSSGRPEPIADRQPPTGSPSDIPRPARTPAADTRFDRRI